MTKRIVLVMAAVLLTLPITAGAASASQWCPPQDQLDPCVLQDVVRAKAGDVILVEATGHPSLSNTAAASYVRRGASAQPHTIDADTFRGSTSFEVVVPASAGRRFVTIVGTLRIRDCDGGAYSITLTNLSR